MVSLRPKRPGVRVGCGKKDNLTVPCLYHRIHLYPDRVMLWNSLAGFYHTINGNKDYIPLNPRQYRSITDKIGREFEEHYDNRPTGSGKPIMGKMEAKPR